MILNVFLYFEKKSHEVRGFILFSNKKKYEKSLKKIVDMKTKKDEVFSCKNVYFRYLQLL